MRNAAHSRWILLLLLILGCSLGLCAEEEQQTAKRANIDVLVVFDTSAREYILDRRRNKGAGTLIGKSEAAIEEINQVISESGLGDFINFRSCGIFEIDYTTQAGDSGFELAKDLSTISSANSPGGTLIYYKKKADPRPDEATPTPPVPNEVKETLPNLETAMAKSGADLAIMFVWNRLTPQQPCILGVAGCYNIAALTSDKEEPSRHAVFNIETLNTASATFSHEVCHLLGAGHADMLYFNPGPQAETDAAAALCYTEDGKAHTSLMGYVSEYDTRKTELKDAFYKDAIIHKILSGPFPLEFNNTELRLGNTDKQNNTAVVLRHASVVSLYHYNGDEVAINDDFSSALPIPPLTSWKDKKSRILQAKALSLLVDYLQGKHGPQTTKKLREYWKKRDKIINKIIKEKSLESKYISPALPQADEQGRVRLACIFGTTTGAKRQTEEGEPALRNGCGNTVWYKLTPPVSGELELGIRKTNTTPGFEPVMGIFKGKSLSTLHQLPTAPVADERNNYFIKRIKATVDANEPLYIAIDNKKNIVNRFNLLVTLTERSNNSLAVTTAGTTATAEPEHTEDNPDSDGILIPKEQENTSENRPDWLLLDSAILTFAIGCITTAIIAAIQIISAGFSINPDPLVGKVKDMNMQFGNIQIGAPKRLRAPITRKDRKFVLSGKLSNGKKKSYTIAMKDFDDNNNFTVGQDSSNALVIHDKTVEKHHCVFKIRHLEDKLVLIIADQGTETGTIIDNTKLTIANASVEVTDGSELILGGCHFKITTAAPSMFKVIFCKFARILRLILFIISLVFGILAVIVLYENRKEQQVGDLVGSDQEAQSENNSDSPSREGYDKNSTLIVLDTESDDLSPKIRYIDLGALKYADSDEIKYDKPDSEGTLRICRVALPEGALNWAQPMQEPSCGDIISITLLDDKKYTFEVTSVDIENDPYKKIVVHGKLQAADGNVTMMLLDKRLLMQIEDNNPDKPRVYNVSFAEENTGKDGEEVYLVQEIDPRQVASSTPLLLTDDSPHAEETEAPANTNK